MKILKSSNLRGYTNVFCNFMPVDFDRSFPLVEKTMHCCLGVFHWCRLGSKQRNVHSLVILSHKNMNEITNTGNTGKLIEGL